jgi:ABC-2 type transport system ATP-binding protein
MSPARTWADTAEAVGAAIGVTGAFSAGDDLLTCEDRPILVADLRHLGRAGAADASSTRSSGSTRSRQPEAVSTCAGGIEQSALPGDDSGRQGAHHRPWTSQPPGLTHPSRRTMWQIIGDLVGAT